MGSWFVPLLGISLAAWVLLRGPNISENGGSVSDEEIAEESRICNTKECRQVANAFVESMNRSVNPCDDFYGFVCGNWGSRHPVSKYQFKWDEYQRFSFLAEARLRDELESEPSSEEILPIQYVKKLYKSCMDNEARESEGLQKISAILQEAKGWPMTLNSDTWNSSVTTWQEIDHYYEKLIGVHAFFTIDTPDSLSGFVELQIEPPVLPLRTKSAKIQRNYTSDGIRVYRSVIKNIAQLFIQHNKEKISDGQLDKDVDDLLKFEETLSKLVLNFSSGYYLLDYNITEFIDYWNVNESLSTSRGRIDWEMILRNANNIIKRPMDNSTWFRIYHEYYFIELEKFLDSTEQRIIVNYIHWNFLSKTLSYTTEEVNDILFQIAKNDYGLQERPPGWLTCVRKMEVKHAAAYLFARKYYPNKSNAAVEEMIRNLKKSFESQIGNSNWLPIEAKEAAINKLNSLRFSLGYPEWYNNETALIKFYENLKVGTSYFEHSIELMKHEWLQLINRWGKSIKGPEWQNVLQVNGYHFRMHNVIRIDRGTTRTDKLFADGLVKIYRKHVRCFVRAFDRYFENATENSIPQRNGKQSSRGKLTLNGNLAEWSGVKAAFHAYKEINDKILNGELKLPGLEEFTDEQMFFISYAHRWCAAKRSKIYENIAMRHSHSPGEIRVIATASNTLEFAEAFNCPKNSPMNPEKKCSIWTNSSAAL